MLFRKSGLAGIPVWACEHAQTYAQGEKQRERERVAGKRKTEGGRASRKTFACAMVSWWVYACM
jgi:hypothetical protein